MVRAAVAIGLTVLLAACSPGSTPDAAPTHSASPTPRDTTTSYVAFGDSFTAGPGITPEQPNAGFCQRSAENWPSLVDKEIGFNTFTDVSCSGATSTDVLTTVGTTALSPFTDLVTLGIGGNDGALFASLISACATDGPACQTFVDKQAPPILNKTVGSIVDVVDAIRLRAPKAQILLVGYLRIMPDQGTCATVGVPASQAAQVESAEKALEAALVTAATKAKVEFVSMRKASQGHDACAGSRAWTNGATPSNGDGIIFHPREAGMQAVATAVESAVRG